MDSLSQVASKRQEVPDQERRQVDVEGVFVKLLPVF